MIVRAPYAVALLLFAKEVKAVCGWVVVVEVSCVPGTGDPFNWIN